MQITSLDDILGDFDPNADADSCARVGEGKPITVWLPCGYHEKYRRLQRSSRLAFSKKVRELIKAIIDRAETKSV